MQRHKMDALKSSFTLVVALLATFAKASTTKSVVTPTSLNKESINRGFEEIAPIVTDVVVKKGDPFVEVFISGFVQENFCYDKKEYSVENDSTETRIIVRFRNNTSATECKTAQQIFSDKAADLDPNHPSSKLVKVLGYYGWQEAHLVEAPVAPQPATLAPPPAKD